jgi:molybdate transport system regulatory protein
MGEYHIDSRIWIGSEKGVLFGDGRIALLREIQLHGSISRAAKAMGMSYKKAWRLVNEMNKHANTPLVKQHIGGKDGGGTELSEAGAKAIQIYTELKEKQREFLNEQEVWIASEL